MGALDLTVPDHGPHCGCSALPAAEQARAAAMVNLASSLTAQQRLEQVVEVLGLQGLAGQGAGLSYGDAAAVRTWLRSNGSTIEGGASEINLNVIAKQVLGLPDPVTRPGSPAT